MPPEALIAIIAIPTTLTGLFLRHISEQRKLDRKERSADRLVWENHLSSTVKAQIDVAVALQRIFDKLDEEQ